MTAALKAPKRIEHDDREAKPVEQRAFYACELPKSTIEAIKRVRMDARHDHLNALLDP